MKRFTALGFAAALSFGLPAYAVEYSVVGLGFEGMQVPDKDGIYQPAQVWQFYNGGFSRSEDGTADLVQGPAYSVLFNDEALAFRSIGQGNGTGNFGPRYLDTQSGPELTDLGVSALSFTVAVPVLNYAKGFGTGFSFYYASQAPVTVTLYDQVDGGGSVLGTLSFKGTPTCDLDDNSNCAWSLGAVAFNGTARSVKLEGVARQTLFDNVTFGSLVPRDGVTPVPEPGTYGLMALGLMGLGLVARRRRARV